MKKKLLMTCISLYSVILFSQVGINTPNPSATLDVLSKGNSATSKSLKVNNSDRKELLTILDNGNVGINSSSPTTKLEIKNSTPGAIRIVDGTQQQGSVLTSDADGLGTWKSLGKVTTVILKGHQSISTGQIPTILDGLVSTVVYDNIGGITFSNSRIHLPKGRYLVHAKFHLINTTDYALFQAADSNGGILYSEYYNEGHNGSFIANFPNNNNDLYFQVLGRLVNPNPQYYESDYRNKDYVCIVTIVKLD